MQRKELYFDYQSSTPVDNQVIEYMQPFWSITHGNPHSNEHYIGWSANNVIENSKKNIANLIGCDRDEIFFTSGATESNNLAVRGFAKNTQDKKRNRILLTSIDHKCVIESAKTACLDNNLSYEFVSVDKEGFIDYEDFERKISEDVLLFSYILVNNEIGTIQDYNKIYDLCSKFNIKIHTDAAQAPTTVDLTEITSKVNMLSLSGHKIYGPMGIGALFIERELQNRVSPIIFGGGQQNNIRSGTLPLPLCAGISKAAEICKNDLIKNDHLRVKKLKEYLVNRILDLDTNFFINGPYTKNHHAGNANICFDGYIAQDLIAKMQPNLAVSTGSACSSGINESSHVLDAIGLSKDQAEASIRLSVGRFTSKLEVDKAINLIQNALGQL